MVTSAIQTLETRTETSTTSPYVIFEQIDSILHRSEGRLNGDDVDFCEVALMHFKQTIGPNIDSFFSDADVSVLPGIMDRIILWRGECIEIRANLFHTGVGDLKVHNHGQPFVSFILEGAYQHNIWNIDVSHGQHHLYHRVPGGIYHEHGLQPGQVVLKHSHVHEPGRGLFVAPETLHSIEPISEGRVVTFTIRDRRKVEDLTRVVSNIPLTLDHQQRVASASPKEREGACRMLAEVLSGSNAMQTTHLDSDYPLLDSNETPLTFESDSVIMELKRGD